MSIKEKLEELSWIIILILPYVVSIIIGIAIGIIGIAVELATEYAIGLIF